MRERERVSERERERERRVELKKKVFFLFSLIKGKGTLPESQTLPESLGSCKVKLVKCFVIFLFIFLSFCLIVSNSFYFVSFFLSFILSFKN